MRRWLIEVLILFVAIGAPLRATAAEILFVSDGTGDAGIVSALTSDGHTVSLAVNDYDFVTGSSSSLTGDLSGYDAIYWSATGSRHTNAAMFTNLTDFVQGGGRVFVTGFDALLGDTLLIQFVGGTGANDSITSPGPVATTETSLSVGPVDIRGVTPTGSRDNDCVTGLMSDTQAVVLSGIDVRCAQWTLRTLGSGEVAFVGAGSNSVWTVTSVGGAGAYNAALRNFAAAGGRGESEPGAPEIVFETESSLEEGGTPTVMVSVSDPEGDSFSFSWDLDEDGSFGEAPDEDTYAIPAEFADGPATVRLGVEAIDGRGNRAFIYRAFRIANVTPTVTSMPPEVISILADIEYQIEAEDPAGEFDPLTFELVSGPERMNVSDSGLVTWVPNESDVTAEGEFESISVRIDDGDGGETLHNFDLIVSTNRRPSPPSPSYPINSIAILDPLPRLATQNSEDLDLDTLLYFFEVDTVDTFDSEELRQSVGIVETPGFSAWQLDEPLPAGQLYYWRVRADDGIVYSTWQTAAFYVVSDGPPVEADAGTVIDAGAPIPGTTDGGLIPRYENPPRSGSGCRLSPPNTPLPGSGYAGLALLGVMALIVRRRA